MKFTKVFILLGLLLSFLPLNAAFAADKTIDNYIPMDLSEDYWAYDALDTFINADLIDGYTSYDEDGILNMEVRPGEDITRAQFVKILVNSLELSSNEPATSFTDVKSDRWYYSYINTASSLGIILGKTDGTFRPDAKITRGELAAMLVRAFQNTIQFSDNVTPTFSDVSGDYRFAPFINKAAEKGIISGYLDGTFKYNRNATRAQAITMIYRGITNEQSNLPDDQQILDFLTQHIKTEDSLTATNSFQELNDLYTKDSMGYYLTENVLSQDDIDMFNNDGSTQITITIDDQNMKLSVLSKSNRFAVVQVSGIAFHLKVTDPSSSFEYNGNLNGSYYLKRNLDGNWKIYNSTVDMEQDLQSAAVKASSK